MIVPCHGHEIYNKGRASKTCLGHGLENGGVGVASGQCSGVWRRKWSGEWSVKCTEKWTGWDVEWTVWCRLDWTLASTVDTGVCTMQTRMWCLDSGGRRNWKEEKKEEALETGFGRCYASPFQRFVLLAPTPLPSSCCAQVLTPG